MKQSLQKWQQFNCDLRNIWTWLGETEEELEQLQHLGPSTDIQSIELQIKKLKVAALGLPMAAGQMAVWGAHVGDFFCLMTAAGGSCQQE